ncbi:MAG TPA: glycosyltransferase family A protein, partial [Bacteroidota bacterium]|nr:glycosyltransferase family A protein [Bacteroidota bacterium]
MTPPLVSIVLCTFNRARLVKRAIDSVLRQSYRNIELIIVDDGSTDGSEKVLLNIAKRDARCIFLRHANQGLARSRNVGWKNASGDFITFIDSDDEYKPNHIRGRVRYFQSHRSVDLIYGGAVPLGPRAAHYVPDIERPGKLIHVSKCSVSGTIMAR